MKEQVEAFYDAVQLQYENAAAGNGPEPVSSTHLMGIRDSR